MKRLTRRLLYAVFDLVARTPEPRPPGWWDEQTRLGDEATAQFHADAKVRADILGRLIEKRKSQT